MAYNVWIPLLLIFGLICTNTEGALTYASNIKSTNVTHQRVVLHWQLPSNITTVSSYEILVISNANTTMDDVTVNDSSLTSYEISNLDIWSTYTVYLTTFDLSGADIGTDSYSFSTRYYFATPETLLATAAVIFIGACYIAALVVRFTCDLETDEGALRKIILAEHEERRRQKRERLRGGGYMRSLTRQFSTLLSWRRHDSTYCEDSISEKSYQSSCATSYEHDKHTMTSLRNTLVDGTDPHMNENDTPLSESDSPMSTRDTQVSEKEVTTSTSGILPTRGIPADASVGTYDAPDDAANVANDTPVTEYGTPVRSASYDKALTEEAVTDGVTPVETNYARIDINDTVDTVCDTPINESDAPVTTRNSPRGKKTSTTNVGGTILPCNRGTPV